MAAAVAQASAQKYTAEFAENIVVKRATEVICEIAAENKRRNRTRNMTKAFIMRMKFF